MKLGNTLALGYSRRQVTEEINVAIIDENYARRKPYAQKIAISVNQQIPQVFIRRLKR